MKPKIKIKSHTLLNITAGVVLTAHEVKKFKTPGFTVKNYTIHQYSKGKLKLLKKTTKNFSRKILIRNTERKLIRSLKKTPNTHIKLTHIAIINGLVKLKIAVIKKEISKLKRRDIRQQQPPFP
ncbi:hypothetical protein ACWNX2_00480 [Candidatus Vidania fulgoroideorum]